MTVASIGETTYKPVDFHDGHAFLEREEEVVRNVVSLATYMLFLAMQYCMYASGCSSLSLL